ncbi:MAG: hypothetical protein ACK41Q_07285 [Candidatus Brocadia sp.]
MIAYNSSNVKIGTDRSDAPFTIEVIELTSPEGGEVLLSGTSHDITWTTNETISPIAKVILSYTLNTLNGGKTWKSICA